MAVTKLSATSNRVRGALPFPRYIDALSFAAATAESWTVPSEVGYVVISSTVPFYFNFDATATVPADTADGSASGYVAQAVEGIVESGKTISILPTGAGVVTIFCYKT